MLMEELQAKQRQEQRTLQGRITQKKKSATKKTRKGVNDECETLQRELDEQQHAELAALDGGGVEERMDDLNISDHTQVPDRERSSEELSSQPGISSANKKPAYGEAPPAAGRAKKPNRQRARLARRAAETEAQIVQAEEEAANMPDQREIEQEAMATIFERIGLKEVLIRPDGHCMYSAIASQLASAKSTCGAPGSRLTNGANPNEGYRAVRVSAADFIEQHADDFAPFLEIPLKDHVHRIRDTAEWGGQLELQAISRAYNVDLNLVQADGRIEKIESGQGAGSKQIWLAYYRHSFGLGEHYNALVKAS